jgi:hypothetical protein
MSTDRISPTTDGRFFSPGEAMEAIERDGFNWCLVRKYFKFTDEWLSEGQYDKMLAVALASIENDVGKDILLDMLDLQYAVFLEQVALQKSMLGEAECEENCIAFGERVMAYLQANANHRPRTTYSRKSARTALLEIPPGQMIQRLLGESSAPASMRGTALQEHKA